METIGDIVREMREYADKQERMSIYDLRDLATETLRVFADRLKAAYKREVGSYKDTIKLWCDRADELRRKCDEQYAELKNLRNRAAHERETVDIESRAIYGEVRELVPNWNKLNNDAKMREALLQIRDSFYIDPDDNECHSDIDASDLREMCDAALAAPRRNCDVGTAEEQGERFILFCRRNSFRGVCNDSCKFANVNRRLGWQKIGQSRCFAFWAQMPYAAEKGGNDGK